MSRAFHATELEGTAMWWSVERRDGVTLGFTSHDRDLSIDGLTYRAAPGMIPSAIRRTSGLDRDAVEVEGVLAHDSIAPADLEAGRFAGARIAIGVVDWETRERTTLFHGMLGDIAQEDGAFEAELRSAKAALEVDLVPRTSPTCRAEFCGAECGANPAVHTHLATVAEVDRAANRVTFAGGPAAGDMLSGSVRWIDGPLAGTRSDVIDAGADGLVLERDLPADLAAGHRAWLREGCDHTIATCAARFGNERNFRGEPHLPGNDLLARYPSGQR